MFDNIVIIHGLLAFILVIYLVVRLVISLFKSGKTNFKETSRTRNRYWDWILFGTILITGVYPLIVLGSIDLYHLLKVVLLGAIIVFLRYWRVPSMAVIMILALGSASIATYLSILDEPRFSRVGSTFTEGSPSESEVDLMKLGELIFSDQCVQCHGQDGKKGLFNAADLTVSELSKEEKIKVIMNGSPLTVMRSFKDILSTAEIEAVASYIHRLEK